MVLYHLVKYKSDLSVLVKINAMERDRTYRYDMSDTDDR
jgi:hypothetical protein